jgi:transcriptional regulator with XRE-family HTH domain
LSQRALAERAHVSASTVTRIERADMDPTIGMLRRLLSAAGSSLTLEATPGPPKPELATLTDAWTRTQHGDRPDWARLRALLDEVLSQPELIEAAIARRPERTGCRHGRAARGDRRQARR